ncbi:TetR/AcrR family transcriptional regulator [Solibacillus sp. FSL H8-0538]|uniref:TetR/AcrR family transcriptional regulator n=1 Tax=Solibacillus sp. FSL H8-0538 TaxID=2921400 RepID=UPI0030F5FD1E
MEKGKYERKTMHTKKEIKEAFTELLDEKGFTAITIRDITTRANLNRGTFYLHYLDKYDLLEKCEEEIFQKLQEMAKNMNPSNLTQLYITGRPHPFIVNIFEYFKENASFLRAVLGPNGDPAFEEKVRKVLIETIFKNASNIVHLSNLTIPIEVVTQFISSAQIGVVRYWLNSNMQQTPEEIATMMFQMLTKGPFAASGLKKHLINDEGNV